MPERPFISERDGALPAFDLELLYWELLLYIFAISVMRHTQLKAAFVEDSCLVGDGNATG